MRITPESNIDLVGDDKVFLTKLLRENVKKDKKDKKVIRHVKETVDSSYQGESVKVPLDSIFKLSPSQMNFEISEGLFNGFDKCLSEQDVEYMLSEKERMKDFKWDNQRLGFNLSNESNWYSFSLPYFSKDKKIALILIRDLCKPFMCGSGYTVVFKHIDGKWSSEKVSSWIH